MTLGVDRDNTVERSLTVKAAFYYEYEYLAQALESGSGGLESGNLRLGVIVTVWSCDRDHVL